MIGRGEDQVYQTLQRFFPEAKIERQFSLSRILSTEEYQSLAPEYQKHKFDFAVFRKSARSILIEVNYKHGKIAREKWQIYKFLGEQYNFDTLTIEDYECPQIFSNTPLSWLHFVEVALTLAKHHISVET